MDCMSPLWSSELVSLHARTGNKYSTLYFNGMYDLMIQKDNYKKCIFILALYSFSVLKKIKKKIPKEKQLMLWTDICWDETSIYRQVIKSIFRIIITWMKKFL